MQATDATRITQRIHMDPSPLYQVCPLRQASLPYPLRQQTRASAQGLSNKDQGSVLSSDMVRREELKPLVFLVHPVYLVYLLDVARRTNKAASPTHHVDRRSIARIPHLTQ